MSPKTSIILRENAVHFERYLSGIFDNEENFDKKLIYQHFYDAQVFNCTAWLATSLTNMPYLKKLNWVYSRKKLSL